MRGLLSQDEMGKLRDALENSQDMRKYAVGKSDEMGRKSRMTLWNYAGNDVTGVLAR